MESLQKLEAVNFTENEKSDYFRFTLNLNLNFLSCNHELKLWENYS